MPPYQGVAGQMILTFFPPGGKAINGFADWNDLGNWVNQIMAGRVEASPEVKQQVVKLTAGKNTQLEKMQAIAKFVQHDIRYVAIELGIHQLELACVAAQRARKLAAIVFDHQGPVGRLPGIVGADAVPLAHHRVVSRPAGCKAEK